MTAGQVEEEVGHQQQQGHLMMVVGKQNDITFIATVHPTLSAPSLLKCRLKKLIIRFRGLCEVGGEERVGTEIEGVGGL